MNRILVMAAALLAAVGYYVSAALAAQAMPPAPEPALGPGAAVVRAPAHPVVITHQTSTWTLLLVAAAAIIVTLVIERLVTRGRKGVGTAPHPTPA